MFGETTISQVKVWNHPTETTIFKWMFRVPGCYVSFGGGRVKGGPISCLLKGFCVPAKNPLSKHCPGWLFVSEGESLMVPTPAVIAQQDFIRTFCLLLEGSYLEDHPSKWLITMVDIYSLKQTGRT